MIETIKNEAGVHEVRYHPDFSALCSVGGAPFHGVLEIAYVPKGALLEFMSFEKWLLADVAKMETTVEGLCRHVFDTLEECLSPDAIDRVLLSVSVHASTTTHAPVSVSIANADDLGGSME